MVGVEGVGDQASHVGRKQGCGSILVGPAANEATRFLDGKQAATMNVHSHPALATFDDMHSHRSASGLLARRPAPAPIMSAGDLAELSREEHRAKFKHTKLCSFYQKGQCTRTFDACAFLHTDDPNVIARLGGVPANAPNPHNRPAHADPHVNPRVNSLQGNKPRPRFPPGSRIMGIGIPKRSKLGPDDGGEPETKRTVCRFFASGMCEYGKDCRFLHIVPEDRPEASPKDNNTLCRNYPGCTYGDRCDFKHIDLNPSNPPDEFGSPFSNASALPPSVSARASPTVAARGPSALAATEPVNAPSFTLGERLGLLGDRPGSSIVGERTSRRHELVRTASFGELPRRETGLLGGVGEERRASLVSEGRGSLTRNASYNGPESASALPSPLVRSSSLNVTTERPSSAFGSLLGLGPASSLLGIGLNAFDRAHASQPHTRTHTPIPRAPSPSPTHIGIPSRNSIAPHPATVLAPSAGFGSSFGASALGTSFGSLALGANGVGGSGSGTNTPSHPLIRTLPPPGNEYSGTGWRVASPLPPHISSELAPPGGSVPGSPLALAPGSPLANAFTNDGFFASAQANTSGAPEQAEHDEPQFGMGLGLTGAGMHFESDGEDLLPTMSYEDFADGFATDAESRADPEEKERPRGYKTLPCKFFNPLLGRDCPAGDACNFIHDKLFSNKFNATPLTNGTSGTSSSGTRRDSISNPSHPLFRTRECKYWAAGRCNQGDECPFKHTYGEDVERQFDSAGSGEGSRDNPYWRTRPCKWFQQGQCLRGDNCNYLHTLETTPVVCKFYPTPGCRNGAECPFVHTELDEDMWAEEQEAMKDFNGGLHVNGNRNGNGASVTNGTGFHPEDEDSEDDVIFEPMRAAGSAQGSGDLSILLSGLALNGHAHAIHAGENGH
ncbi:hypothetical protein FRC09_004169 [Ceratobasidium sp. 395]|nr:hypothetical protein FRC09_004169 [Ceratobasidium sp. 395]